jgi:DNA replication protein DnaC
MYDQLQSMAHQLRLFGIHGSVERRCQEALAEALHPGELVRLILEDESDARRRAAAKRLTKRAKFRREAELEGWDWTRDRGLSKAKFKELALLNFYHRALSLIIDGPTGVGKTELALALGHRLCAQGISVQFYSVNLFFEEIMAARVGGTYLKFVEKLRKVSVIIFDDFGLRSYTHDEASALQDILEERYGKGINIITSQVSPAGWLSLFEDRVIGESIVDRLSNPTEIITLKGESVRPGRSIN